MPNLTEMERRNYEQRLARLEDIALRLSGELFMEGPDLADTGAKEKVILVSTILHDPAEMSAQGVCAGACRLIEQIIEIRLRERKAAESRQGGAVAWASGPGGPGRCCNDFHVPR